MDVLVRVTSLLLVCTSYCSAGFSHAGYTFLSPGKSYIEYKPHWSLSHPIGIQFSFRTQKANTFLMHHAFATVNFGKHKPQIWIKLRKGELQVTHKFGDDIQSISMGKGLNHDKWHKVSIILDTERANLSVAVDSQATKSIILTSFSEGSARKAVGLKKVMSIVSFGGFSPESLQEPVLFIGCIREINYFEGKRILEVGLDSKHGLKRGCSNHCESDNPCVHAGTCINHYTHTACDCFNSGYEGKHCEKEGLTTLTLLGKEWVGFNIHSEEESTTHTPATRVAFNFKTRAPNGILFYARELYQHRNHLAVSLYNGSLYVSVYFVDQISQNELFVSLGTGLDDERWHRVNVSHQGRGVDVSVDFETVKMTADHSHPHLRMPRTVYYGGMDISSDITGLKSTKNFVGCLQGVYFNHKSVLEQLNTTRATYYHGQPQYGCQDVTRTAMQLTTHGAFVKVEHRPSDTFDIQLDFRTLKKECVLSYTETSSGVDRGFIKVELFKGQVELVVVPDRYQTHLNLSLLQGQYLNDNEWHTLTVSFKNRLAKLVIDGMESEKETAWSFINVENSTYIGSGPDTDISESYIGCMKNVAVQSVVVDPVETFHSQLGVGITLGSCDLVDWCRRAGSPCQHGGRCISYWNDTHCDCKDIDYSGKYCQFADLRRSCDEYYQGGERRSGVWQIDMDGAGPLPPRYVYCQMGMEIGGHTYGVTRIDHNLRPNTMVRQPGAKDIRLLVNYRNMNKNELRKLVGLSEHCRQNVAMACRVSKLWMGHHTWLVSAGGEKFSTLGGNVEQACQCHELGTCRDTRYTCNCDKLAGSLSWVTDGGYVDNKDHLPISELAFLQRGGEANVTLGPLECYGSYTQEDNFVMFTESTASLRLAGWQGGNLEFVFRTTEHSAVLLYQAASDYSTNNYQLILMLRGERFVYIKMNVPKITETVQLKSRLNTGSLQYVALDFSDQQMRLRVNGEEFYFNTGPGVKGPGKDATNLFVASNVSGLFPGMTGCFGGLRYNGELVILPKLVHAAIKGVRAGCISTCDSNPCHQGAACIEHWTHYACQCANVYSQLGQDCQQDINVDSISFESETGYLFFHRLMELDLLATDLVFSFRTSQTNALLLFAADHLNNFIQIQLNSGSHLVMMYNSDYNVFKKELEVKGLNDGTWKQVAVILQPVCSYTLVKEAQLKSIGRPVTRLTDMDIKTLKEIDHPEVLEGWYAITQPCITKMVVESIEVTLNSHKHNLLTDYVPNPYMNQTGLLHQMFQSQRLPGLSVYVGGAPDVMTPPSGLVGCFRGLRMGKSVFPLGDSAATADKEGVAAGCVSGCYSSPCANGGRCVDDREVPGHYSCDCSLTGYVGPFCSYREYGLLFDGYSWLLEKLKNMELSNRLRRATDRSLAGYQLRLDLNFTAKLQQTSNFSLLAYIGDISGLNDHFMLTLGQSGHVGMEVSLAGETVHMESPLHSPFGIPHRVTLVRDHTLITLKVDDAETVGTISGDSQMAPPTTLMLGGLKKDNKKHMTYGNYTGKMSNVFLVSDQLSPANARPIEVFYGHLDGNHGLETAGNLRTTSQQIEHPDSGSLYRTGAHMGGDSAPGNEGEGFTFPPWSPGDAQTVDLIEPKTPPVDSNGSSGVSPVVAFLVCFVVLAVFVGLIVVVVIRSRRRKAMYSPPQQPPKDEEEGLLQLAPKEESAEKLDPEDPTFSGSAKNRRETAMDKKNATDEDATDEENEETPMLKNMEPNDTFEAPEEQIEMSSFQDMIENLPMIDEMDMSDDDMYHITLQSPQKEAYQPLYRRNSGDLEWDPQMDTATPILPGEDIPVSVESIQRPPEERGRAGESFPEQTETTNPDSYYNVPREVWTESQVLGAMDIIAEESSEESEPSWDHSVDTSTCLHGQEEGSVPSLSDHSPSSEHSLPSATTDPPESAPGDGPGDGSTPGEAANIHSGVKTKSSEEEDHTEPEGDSMEVDEYPNRETSKIKADDSVEYYPEVPTLRRMNDFDSEPELDTEPVEIQVTADVHRSRGNSESLSQNLNEGGINNDQNQNYQGPYDTEGPDQGNNHIDMTNGNFEAEYASGKLNGYDRVDKKLNPPKTETVNGITNDDSRIKASAATSNSTTDTLNCNGNNNLFATGNLDSDCDMLDSDSELCSNVSDPNDSRLPLIPSSNNSTQKDISKYKMKGKR